MAFRYRDIIKRAAETTWQHKFLWFFGLFAALTSNGEEYDSLFRNSSFISDLQNNASDVKLLADDGSLAETWNGFVTYLSDNIFSSVGVVIGLLVIFLFVAWLIIISQVALISSAARKYNKQPLDLVEGFWTGNKMFFPVLAINIISLLVIYGILLLLSLPLLIGFFSSGNLAFIFALIILTLLVLIPLNIVASFVVKYASAFVIVKGSSLGQAIVQGWKLFIKNWLVSIETAFLLFLINFLVSLLIIGAISITGLPVVSNTGFFVFFGISALLGAILATFQYTAWTYLFMELTEKRAISKLIRWFKSGPSQSSDPNKRSTKSG